MKGGAGAGRPAARRFTRFACIDWSGAVGPAQPGIAVAVCDEGDASPRLIAPRGRAWSRGEVLEWLLAQAGAPILIGLDLSTALPFADRDAYFPGWPASPADARALWETVDTACADDPHHAAAAFLALAEIRRHFRLPGAAGDRMEAGRGRLRVCERRVLEAGLSPTSSFNLIGAAQVGKASLTGMRVLHRLAGRLPVWPFDPIPRAGAMIVEIYTTIAARAAGVERGRSKLRDAASLDAALAALGSAPAAPLARYTDHATDALVTAAWLRRAACEPALWFPAALTPTLAATEGWTFGVA